MWALHGVLFVVLTDLYFNYSFPSYRVLQIKYKKLINQANIALMKVLSFLALTLLKL